MNLPPLPKPDGAAPVVTDKIHLSNGLTGDVEDYVDAWSEPLVRAFGESCARMAREEADLTYYRACEEQNIALLEAIGYPHKKDTLDSPEEYAADLKRKADAFDALGAK